MSGWQPIETAPRDGSDVVLTDGAEIFIAWWVEETERFEDFKMFFGPAITHWLPVPPLPIVSR